MSLIPKLFPNKNCNNRKLIYHTTKTFINVNNNINIKNNLNVKYFSSKNNSNEISLSNLDLTKLNKTCIYYDYIAKIKELKDNEKEIIINEELLESYIHKIDYHTLMALKHASCGAIDVTFLYKKDK